MMKNPLYYAINFPNLEEKLFTVESCKEIWIEILLLEAHEIVSNYPTTVENATIIKECIEHLNHLNISLSFPGTFQDYKAGKEPIFTTVNNYIRNSFLPSFRHLEGKKVLFLLQLATANLPKDDRQKSSLPISTILTKLLKHLINGK